MKHNKNDHNHELPYDTLVVGRFAFIGVPDDDTVADIVTIKDKQIGLVFDINPEVELLLRRLPKDCTPTDNDRITAHIEALTEQQYISSLARLLEYEFREQDPPLQIVDIWDQCYAYRKHHGRAQHCRLLTLHYPNATSKEEYDMVCSRVAVHRRKQARLGVPIPFMEVYAGGITGDEDA